jgi:hypothetical protein
MSNQFESFQYAEDPSQSFDEGLFDALWEKDSSGNVEFAVSKSINTRIQKGLSS